MTLQTEPIVKVEMLIRKPIGEVFEAFVDPAITTQFWFTKSSGRLEPGPADWAREGGHTEIADALEAAAE